MQLVCATCSTVRVKRIITLSRVTSCEGMHYQFQENMKNLLQGKKNFSRSDMK